MVLTPEQEKIGRENFSNAVEITRRDAIKAAAAGSLGLGAAYFGYKELTGEPVRVGFIGTGDEGGILINEHPPKYMDIVAISDLRPSNRERAFKGEGNENRMGLIKKLGADKASKIEVFNSHKELI